MIRGPRGPVALFVTSLVLLVGAVAYSLAARQLALAPALQYLPKESELILAAGDLESLWAGVDRNFRSVIREEPPAGLLAPLLDQVAKTLAERNVPLREPAELAGYGIDARGGMLLAVDRLDDPGALVVILRVTDEGKLKMALAAALEAPLRSEPVTVGADVPAVAFGKSEAEFWVAFPERGVAVVATALAVLRRAVGERRETLRYVRADDGLFEAVRRRRHWRMLVGPEVLVSWRPLRNPLVMRATGVFALFDDGVRLEVDIELATRGVRTLDDILAGGRLDGDWAAQAGTESAFTVAFQHPNTSRFLPFVAAALGGELGGPRGGILGQLAALPDLRQIAVVIPRYREGLPDLLLGVWADPPRMQTLVADLQRAMRARRDEHILTAAAKEYCAKKERASCAATVKELERAHLLVPEPHDRFKQYQIVAGDVRRVATAPAPLEDTRTYAERWRLTQLAPAITRNDVLYRPELADADPATLQSDRYRLVATVAAGVLWIATEQHDLTAFLDRTGIARDRLSTSPLFRAANQEWDHTARLQAFLNTDRTMTIALRSGEKTVSDAARTYLHDFRNHPVIAVQAVPVDRGRRLRVQARALRWSALPAP